MKLIIFDCDGVLIDSEFLHAQVEVDLLRECFGWETTPQEHNKLYCGLGLPGFFKCLEEKTGASLPQNFAKTLEIRKKEAFSTQLKAISGVFELLANLSLPACVASNTPLETVELCLKTTNLYDFFAPNIFSADNVPHGKPAPDLFLYAAEKMGAAPADCLVIEDSSHGVTAARAAGMRVFGFTGGSHCYEGYAKARLGDAEKIASSMKELNSLLNENL